MGIFLDESSSVLHNVVLFFFIRYTAKDNTNVTKKSNIAVLSKYIEEHLKEKLNLN